MSATVTSEMLSTAFAKPDDGLLIRYFAEGGPPFDKDAVVVVDGREASITESTVLVAAAAAGANGFVQWWLQGVEVSPAWKQKALLAATANGRAKTVRTLFEMLRIFESFWTKLVLRTAAAAGHAVVLFYLLQHIEIDETFRAELIPVTTSLGYDFANLVVQDHNAVLFSKRAEVHALLDYIAEESYSTIMEGAVRECSFELITMLIASATKSAYRLYTQALTGLRAQQCRDVYIDLLLDDLLLNPKSKKVNDWLDSRGPPSAVLAAAEAAGNTGLMEELYQLYGDDEPLFGCAACGCPSGV